MSTYTVFLSAMDPVAGHLQTVDVLADDVFLDDQNHLVFSTNGVKVALVNRAMWAVVQNISALVHHGPPAPPQGTPQ